MKIGILGGSFDPIHYGHLYMAEQSYKEYNLDEIWLIPAGHSPNKNEDHMTSQKHRYKMCKLAAEDYPYINVSDYEINQMSTTYTYLTLQAMVRQFPQHDFYFIMGGDSLDYFEDWAHPEIISSLCTILAVVREGFDHQAMQHKKHYLESMFPCNIEFVHCSQMDISSTQIRQNFYHDANIQKYIPAKVVDYIIQHKLYVQE